MVPQRPAVSPQLSLGRAGSNICGAQANIVMAWNTAQMQGVLDRWANRRQIVPPELIGRIAPTRLEGINLRGVFRFPVERYAGQLLPSQTAAKTSASD
jgi:Tn3 transposase DDE domain